ncbi:MAG: hypothetical protein M3017_12320 [Actinomycetota bacterium]|nr:hypothetical protein [Actinomycetota bacterium]
METAIEKLRQLPLGTRVVVRYRLDDGTSPGARGSAAAQTVQPFTGMPAEPVPPPVPALSDALGFLTALDPTTCTVQTKSGDVVVVLASVRAVKAVQPAPPRRPRRSPGP